MTGAGAHAHPIERRPADLFQSNVIKYHYIDVRVRPCKMVATMNRLELKNGIEFWTQPETVNITAPLQVKAAAKRRRVSNNCKRASFKVGLH